jgi:uncharacterized protein (TIGR02246 family)
MITSSYLPYRFVLPVILTLAPSIVTGQAAPSRSAVGQIRRIENVYAEAFNRKDTTAVTSMYARDAIFIRGDGSVLVGQDTIRKMIAAEAPHWPKITIQAESTRVNGQTAWESGTVRFKGGTPSEEVDRYLIVFRRGPKDWKINSLAVVPQHADTTPPLKVKPSGQ